jgi:bifunctional ADP-heptose synthase (sugar kinase/adenylyltransferase)
MAWILLIIAILIIGFLTIGVVNLTKRAEKLEEQLDEAEVGTSYYRDVMDKIRERMLDTQTRMIEVDIRGSFEADDEVGYVFKELKSMIDDLNKTVQSVYE